MVITDDSLDATEAHSETSRAAVHTHFRALSTRRVDPLTFRWINIGQRLHESDAGGWCREHGFETLCLPTEYDPSRHCTTSIGFTDWRTFRGELLFPALFGAAQVQEAKDQLGPYDYSAQHQQQPVPADGGVLKRKFFLPIDAATFKHGLVFQSVDTAFTEDIKNDMSAITTWGVGKSGIILLDAWSARLEMPELLLAIEAQANRWKPTVVLIEAKANGLSIIQTLTRNPKFRYRIEGVTPKLSKNARAHAAAPFVARGRVFLPAGAPMSEDLLRQAEVFPAGKVRDLADSAVQAFLYADATYTFDSPLSAEMLAYEGGGRTSSARFSPYATTSDDD
jgi:predicted phage terminase large subunit-like protein